jgi:hypothetical protein
MQRRSPADPAEEPPLPSLQRSRSSDDLILAEEEHAEEEPCRGGDAAPNRIFFLEAFPATEPAFTDLTVLQSATYRPVSASHSPLLSPLLIFSSSHLP